MLPKREPGIWGSTVIVGSISVGLCHASLAQSLPPLDLKRAVPCLR